MTQLFHFDHLSSFPSLVHGISDRFLGSVYPDREGRARRALAAALGVPAEALVRTHQVHGDVVLPVPSAAYGRWEAGQGADGLVTDRRGLFLLGYFADCVPLLAYDPGRPAVGLAHAGWRGTLLGIAERLVETMARSFSAEPSRLLVGVGPSIGPCCYEVGSEVIEAVVDLLPDGEGLLRPSRPGHAYFDLWQANRQALVRAGVPGGQIEVAGLCTACQVDRFFSYRRERRLNGLFGAAIGISD